MNRALPAIVGAVILVCSAQALLAQKARQASELQSVTLPQNTGEWAVSSTSGGVAVIDLASNAVVLYPDLSTDLSLDSARRQPVGTQPVSIVHKPLTDGGFFVVACKGDRTIHVLDEKTLKPVKVFRLPAGAPRYLSAASSPDSPLVYFATTKGDVTQFTGTIGRLDLAKMMLDGPMEMYAHDEVEVASSADGSIFYLRRVNLTPAGFEAWTTQPPAGPKRPSRAIPLYSEHTEKPRYMPDALGQTVATGKVLFSANLENQIAELPADVVRFLRKKPVILGIKDNALVAMSCNDYRLVGKAVELPALPAEDDQAKKRREYGLAEPRWDVCVNEKNDVVLARQRQRGREGDLLGNSIVIVPMSLLELPEQPFLYAELAGSRELTIGQAWTSRIEPADARSKIELASTPEGMTLDGDTLKWTPASEQVGVVNAVLRISAGDIERTQSLKLTVRQRSVSLPFAPHELLMSPDGSRAVALHPFGADLSRRSNDGQDRATRVLLIDTVDARILAERTLSYDVNFSRQYDLKSCAIDDERVYLPAMSADAMYVLSLKDLSDIKRIFTPGRPTGMRVAGEKLYISIQDKPVQAYALPDVDPLPAEAPSVYSPDVSSVPMRVGTGWYHRGTLYDETLTQPRLLAQSMQFPLIPPSQEQQQAMQIRDQTGLPFVAWDVRRFNGSMLQRSSGQNVGTISGQDVEILPTIPAAVALAIPDNSGRQIRAELVVHDLVTANPVTTFPLIDEPRPAVAYGSSDSRDTQPVLDCSTDGKLIAAMVGDRLFLLETDPIKKFDLPEPLWIEPVQSSFVISPNRPTTLKYIAHGGRAPLEFSLMGNTPGVSIDPATGVVTVDALNLNDAAAEAISRWMPDRFRYNQPSGKQRSPDEIVEAYRTQSGDVFAEFTGQTPTGLPVALPIGVIVSDAEQQQAQLCHLVLLDIDPTLVAAKTGAPGAVRRAPVARAKPEVQVQRQQQPPDPQVETAPDSSGDIASLKRRIAELEKENAELRRKTD